MRPAQPLTAAWQDIPVVLRGITSLGVSFRPLQAGALGLDPHEALQTLLGYPFQVIRLGAYWNRIEPSVGAFLTGELDRQLDAAEQAGKQIILCVGPIKTFGYPEFFVPARYLGQPLPEHMRITPATHPALLAAATDFIARLVERYKQRQGIIAWQLEHEAVDPLGVEHSWRLDHTFVEQEVAALRASDPGRPIMMNGFLPTSSLVGLTQWRATHDQGDSLAVSQRLADIVGIDYYPRHALLRLGARTLYLDGSASRLAQRRLRNIFVWAEAHGRQVMIAEGQAEPWEAVTTPPNPAGQRMASCLPEHIIASYNTCMRLSHPQALLSAYLFWGAEYWLLRAGSGDPGYLQAFARVLEEA